MEREADKESDGQDRNDGSGSESNSGKIVKYRDSYRNKDNGPVRSTRSAKRFRDFATEGAANSDKSFGRASAVDTDNH